ncbi:LamG-like jellyroll fold domain-containing protein [Alistipes sp.]|uniref:LamG-like jellyroll fold domain-containing protein n=1 Tax=Alistipes sp. TaxID=1872444 RepID=UPI0025C2C33E|nr:LamG-like jellyroll fold domain-containing protein [Alistipes sp.]
MKIANYFTWMAVATAALTFASCKQDLGQNPGFDYPREAGVEVPIPAPLFHASFEDDLTLDGTLKATMTAYRDVAPAFEAGKRDGRAYRNQDGTALMIRPDAAGMERLKNLGSFSVFMWVNWEGQNPSACSLFALGHKDQEIGNLLLFVETFRKEDPKEFFVKGYLRSTGTEGGPDAWFDAGDEARLQHMAGKWRHVGVTYDAATSTITLYNQGAEVCHRQLRNGGMGALKFDEISGICLGAFPAMVGLTPIENWPARGTFYDGLLDEFNFFGEALSAAQVAALYEKTK